MIAADNPVFLDAELRPNPPMKPAALLWVLIVVAAINLGFAILFMLRGAWPVTPFMGADVALLAWAFHASRVAARASEHIRVTPESLSVDARSPRGQQTSAQLNPYWVRVDLDTRDELPRRLTLRSHGQSLLIGKFLAPRERHSFALALRSALAEARAWRPN